MSRKSFINVWKSTEPGCGCKHEQHEPGKCTQCNCGQSEIVQLHGHNYTTPTRPGSAYYKWSGGRQVGGMFPLD